MTRAYKNMTQRRLSLTPSEDSVLANKGTYFDCRGEFCTSKEAREFKSDAAFLT